jgi:hypothetical protein
LTVTAADTHDVALVSQMRAGTHYMCAALRVGLEAALLRPGGEDYVPMTDGEILGDLHPESRFALPPPRPGRRIYFSHYYHPQFRRLPSMPRLSLIGFPLDSFYSDGVVYSDTQHSAGPSLSRPHAEHYVLRHGSEEWNFLEQRMHQNAQWLGEIGREPRDLVVRYEDLTQDFNRTAARISDHIGLLNPLPKPVINRKRTYWTQAYETRFDRKALVALTGIFANALARFYPERAETLAQFSHVAG